MSRLRFTYDVVCPYAYIASTRVADLARRAGVELEWHPVLLGGIFRSIDAPTDPNAVMPAPKAALNRLDARRQADLAGVELNWPAEHPRRTVTAMRLLHAVDAGRRAELTAALYRAYWVSGEDLADLDVLQRIAAPFGLDVRAVDRDPEVRQALFDATAEAVAAGAFGVPTFTVGDRIWWGADRLDFVREALGLPSEPEPVPDGRPHSLTFFHDFASPFSYLASTRIEEVARRGGAELEVVPFLLGALFKQIGTPIVPIETFSAPRRAYQERDMQEWAARYGVTLRWPSHFPLRTVTALRASIVEPRALHPLYRAAWVDDRNIGDDDVVAAVLDEAGLAGADIVAKTRDPDVKARLFANTGRAIDAGACGAPTFVVDGRHLFWGQDRLPMVAKVLAGWTGPQEAA